MAIMFAFKKMMAGALLVAGLSGSGLYMTARPLPQATKVPAREAWQSEFDEICTRTQDSMNYSQEELTALIRRCDALLPQIEKLDETRRKVYAGRLKMCRGLYAYVLESKKNEKK